MPILFSGRAFYQVKRRVTISIETNIMPKYTRNIGKPITPVLVRQIRHLARENTPTRVIGLLTGRTENSVRNIASNNDISLKPTNQAPYGTRKK